MITKTLRVFRGVFYLSSLCFLLNLSLKHITVTGPLLIMNLPAVGVNSPQQRVSTKSHRGTLS